MPAAFLCFRSLLMRSSDRACGLAGTALDAEFRIDDMLPVTFGDGSYRAAGCAGAAVYTIITDYIWHI